jgi:hypothetical protein
MHGYIAQPGACGGLAGALKTLRAKSANSQFTQLASHTEIPTLPVCVSAVKTRFHAARLHNLKALGFGIDRLYSTPSEGAVESASREGGNDS